MKWLAPLIVIVLCACGPSGAQGAVKSAPATSSPTIPILASPAPSGTGSSPTPAPSSPPEASIKCSSQPAHARAMALLQRYGQSPVLDVVDVSDPIKPVLLCTLAPAGGARFQSASKITFWSGSKLGTADLASRVVEEADLHIAGTIGAVSPDGTAVVYHVPGDQDGWTAHLLVGGVDRTLYAQQSSGGHGAPPQDRRPLRQLQFSPDGKELLDYYVFRPTNLLVFKIDGSMLFQQSGEAPGVWAAQGSTLYFPVTNQSLQTGEIDSLDSAGQRRTVATGLKGFWWPSLSPDGRSIVYNTPDIPVPDCEGMPDLWRLDLSTGNTSRLSNAISSGAVFIGPKVVWSNEEKQTQCYPGGSAAADGVVLAHDLNTGSDTAVDSSFYRPTAGEPSNSLSSNNVLDVILASS